MRAANGLLLALCVVLAGCWRGEKSPRPLEVKVLPDISASVSDEARTDEFEAIRRLLLRLHRGDSITIIPITGDANADLQGQILRYTIPQERQREAYDADLRRLSGQVAADLTRIASQVAISPGRRTDILGTLRTAMRDFSVQSADRKLILLSDFLEDDEEVNFVKAPRLNTPAEAARYAIEIRPETGIRSDVEVCMGRLRSDDYTRLKPNRQRAIDVFWETLLAPAELQPDGTDMMRPDGNCHLGR